MTAPPTLSVGVIGTGMVGTEHARTLARRTAGATVAGVFDVDAERAKAIAHDLDATVFDTADALIASDDVDAVLIATPGAWHAPHVLACVAAAKPVMCEKPLAASVDDCAAIVAAEVKAGRRFVQVGFMRRFDPGYLEVKGAIDAGRIGQPLLVHHVHRNPVPPPSFTSELMLTDGMIHEFDITRWLLNDEIAAVRVLAPRPTPHAPEDRLDPQLAILEMASGAVADAEMFASAAYGYDVRCEVVGSDGVAALETPRLSTLATGGTRAEPVPDGWMARFGVTYRIELQAWADATRAGVAAGPSAWDGYAATLVAERAVEAQRSGERVPVELMDKPALYG